MQGQRWAAMAVAMWGVLALGGAGEALAQAGPGGAINPQRDCQTLLTCQFKKGRSWRGCVSSYSCRTCDFVSAPCSRVGSGRRRVCRQLRCEWGA